MKSTWIKNGFFDVEMVEEPGRYTAKVYLRGMNESRALIAEATFRSNEVACKNAIDNAMDRIAELGRTVDRTRGVSAMAEQLDYRALLKAYMRGLWIADGISYIPATAEVSQEEYAELQRIRDEAIQDIPVS